VAVGLSITSPSTLIQPHYGLSISIPHPDVSQVVKILKKLIKYMKKGIKIG
jgi:hypothetical protein